MVQQMICKWIEARRERKNNLKAWRVLYLKTLKAPEKASDFMIEMAVKSMPKKVRKTNEGEILWRHYVDRVLRKKLEGNYQDRLNY